MWVAPKISLLLSAENPCYCFMKDIMPPHFFWQGTQGQYYCLRQGAGPSNQAFDKVVGYICSRSSCFLPHGPYDLRVNDHFHNHITSNLCPSSFLNFNPLDFLNFNPSGALSRGRPTRNYSKSYPGLVENFYHK